MDTADNRMILAIIRIGNCQVKPRDSAFTYKFTVERKSNKYLIKIVRFRSTLQPSEFYWYFYAEPNNFEPSSGHEIQTLRAMYKASLASENATITVH